MHEYLTLNNLTGRNIVIKHTIMLMFLLSLWLAGSEIVQLLCMHLGQDSMLFVNKFKFLKISIYGVHVLEISLI